MTEELRVRWLKVLLLVSSLVCLAFLLLAAFEENFEAEWRAPQLEYAALLAQKKHDSAPTGARYPVELRQTYLKDWNRVDRCVSCHVGIDNPDFRNAKQPLTTHPGTLLARHPVDKFGCTICHQGQGRATDKDGAHGRDPFWTQPLLTGALVQSTCVRCHREENPPQAPILMRGRRLVADLGCAGCHQIDRDKASAKVGPPLASVGSKTSRKWLVQWLRDPKNYLPKAKMPQYGVSADAVEALADYLLTFRDPAIDSMPPPAGESAAGAALYRESQCIVCHVTKEDAQGNPVGGSIGQDLRRLAEKVNPRWLSAFLGNPHSFEPETKMPHYRFSERQRADLVQFAMEEWGGSDQKGADAKQPQPAAESLNRAGRGKTLFRELGCAGCHDLTRDDVKLAGPDLTSIGSKSTHELDFGLAKIRRTIPDFLFTKLKSPKAFARDGGTAKMPDFRLSDDDALAVTVALMSHADTFVPSSDYLVAGKPKAEFNPPDKFGALARRYRCLSCHSVRDSGDRLASDLTWEESRVNGSWLLRYLKTPYSMRRTLTIAMPIFHFPDDEIRLMTDYISEVFVDTRIGEGWERNRDRASAKNGKALFDAKGCIACHQIHGKGGDVGPSLTTQVPEFPQGTWVGDKLKGGWIYEWLKNPQSLVPDTLDPNLGFNDQEALDLTAYLLTLKNPEFREKTK